MWSAGDGLDQIFKFKKTAKNVFSNCMADLLPCQLLN